jgi:hypothetical protein
MQAKFTLHLRLQLNFLTNLLTELLLFSICIKQMVLLVFGISKVGVFVKGPCLLQSILDT